MAAGEHYTLISQRKQAERASKIPKEWLLKVLPGPTVINVTHVPRQSGILSERELQITESADATALAEAIRKREYTAVEVTTAFCKVLMSPFSTPSVHD